MKIYNFIVSLKEGDEMLNSPIPNLNIIDPKLWERYTQTMTRYTKLTKEYQVWASKFDKMKKELAEIEAEKNEILKAINKLAPHNNVPNSQELLQDFLRKDRRVR